MLEGTLISSALADGDWTQAAIVLLLLGGALAVAIRLLTRRRQPKRTGFLSWEVQLDRKRSGRPRRDQRTA